MSDAPHAASKGSPLHPCSTALRAPSLTKGLTHCRRCLKGTTHDYHVFLCIGKLAYLRQEYDFSKEQYLRAAALSLLRCLDYEELRRLKKRAVSACGDAVEVLKEHDPTLVYHLGHAHHAATDNDNPDFKVHLTHYSAGIRGLAPRAYHPSPNLLVHFYNQGLSALHQGIDLVFTVIEQYCRLSSHTIL